MALIHVQNANIIFNNVKLLNKVNFHINEKDRICLIGKNGTGKSTFLNIIAREESLDSGSIIYKKNIKIKYLKQNAIYHNNQSIFEFICEGFEEESKYLKNYFDFLENKNFQTLSYTDKIKENLKNVINAKKLWKKKEKIDEIINNLNLNKNDKISLLSRGCLRKVELGKILVGKFDLILLDEPTNYLDITTINWLEEFLIKSLKSMLFVSHNRSFINKVSTKIINLHCGNLISWTGNYDSFLQNQYNNICISERKKIKFDKKIRKEISWANSGVKARSTKSESRIKELKKMVNIKKSNVSFEKKIEILINQDNYKGDIFFKLKNICFSINGINLIHNFSDTIKKGEKIALLGTNGSGKSTLLKLIVGTLVPNNGNIYSNTNVKISYFDQERTNINLKDTVLNNLSHAKEEILINEKKYHKSKYLEKFLFPREKLKLKAKELSGGELNKLLLAKLFLKKSNVLILDEPTNDLDLESLENLEYSLKKYKGIVLLISHDETFIKNVANKYWNFEKNGNIKKYLNFHNTKELTNSKITLNNTKAFFKKNREINQKKINNNTLKKELKNILKKIEKIENHISELQCNINSSEFFLKLSLQKKETLNTLKILEKKLKKYLLRWEYLELHVNKLHI
ncbi:MAG: ATP-binding cassette domain-containing protein [Buchnera aphidicola (Nurudea yanoniella)]